MKTKMEISVFDTLKERLSTRDVWTKGQVQKLIDKILIQYLLEDNPPL